MVALNNKSFFLLGSHERFLNQEARAYLMQFSVNSAQADAVGFNSQSFEQSKHKVSAVISAALSTRQNPTDLLQKLSNFQNSGYFEYDMYDQHDRASDMHSRFADVAVKSLDPLTSPNYDAFSKYHQAQYFRHSDSPEVRAGAHLNLDKGEVLVNQLMSDSIHRQMLNVVVEYLNVKGQDAELSANSIDAIVDTQIVEAFKNEQALQTELTHKLFALHDLKDSILQSYHCMDFLQNYGDAIAREAFNPVANKHIFDNATSSGIEVPADFHILQGCLSDIKDMGFEFKGEERIRLPQTQMELSSIFTREGVDVGSPQLKMQAMDYRQEISNQVAQQSPFVSNVQNVEQKAETSLADLLQKAQNEPDISSPGM